MTEVTPVDPKIDIEPHEVGLAVQDVLGVHVSAVDRVAGFIENEDFAVSTTAGLVFVKAGIAGSLIAEAWACEQARAIGIPAPRVLAMDVDQRRLARAFIVLETVTGDPLDIERPEASAVLARLGAQLRQLHDLDVEGFGYLAGAAEASVPRGPFDTWKDFLSEPVSGVAELFGAGLVTRRERDELLGLLATTTTGFEGRGRLLHGDLKPGHIFVDDGELTGVIDWGDTASGDPLFDLARFSLAGEASLRWLARGYELDLDSMTSVRFYRLVWSLIVVIGELRAAGDWFEVPLGNIRTDLRHLRGAQA